MTAAEYRGTTLPANRQPELRIAWACDPEGFVTRVHLLGPAKNGEPTFMDAIRRFRGGSVIAPEDVVMDGWPVDEHGRGLTLLEVHHLRTTYAVPNEEAAA